MIFPNARRNNARYRGPMESWKTDTFFVEAGRNLQVVRQKLESLQVELSAVQQQADKPETMLGKERINQLIDQMDRVKGAVN